MHSFDDTLQGSISRLVTTILALALLWLALAKTAMAADVQDVSFIKDASSIKDTWFLKAIHAWQDKNPALLSEAHQNLQAQAHPLAPYAEYWALSLQLNRADTATVRDFLQRHADFPFQDRLRGEWLKVLGKRQDWQSFMEEWPQFRREDMAVQCYALQARALTGDTKALPEAKPLWLKVNEPPENCERLFDLLQNAGLLSEQDIWLRVRLAMQEGKVSLAKSSLSRLQPAIGSAQKGAALDKIYQNPQQFLEHNKGNNSTAWGRLLQLVAMERLARSQPEYALSFWQKYQKHFSKEEQDYLWGRLALYAARKHLPQTLDWYAQISPEAVLDTEQWAWKARAAIRSQHWQALADTLNTMPATMQQEAVWRYWKARTLKMQQQTLAANSILLPLSRERGYYALLAEEALGDVIGAMPNDFKINDVDVQKAASLAGIQRASALQNYDLRSEARQEWQLAIQSLDDRQLLALAEYAARQQWYDLSILTADKTRFMHDSSLRYPTPFRDLMQSAAQAQALETDWVYGITRQESRFMHFARSGAGAVGLMQVMPATASWIAKRMGWQEFRQDKVQEIESNIRLGTYYMRYTLDTLNGQMLLATAAYNAGPSRARRWLGQAPMDGTIYAETIPFTETRQYVQKVMANTYYYAQRLGLRLKPMTQRMAVNIQQAASTVQESENSEKITE